MHKNNRKDTFGRLIELVRPGDSSAAPTLAIDYNDDNPNFSAPFIVTLTQKINDTQEFTIARQYDGMGRPTLVTTNDDIFVNYAYGYADGKREDKQSTPHTSAETVYWTKVKYDSLARPFTITAPDGAVTSYAYNGLETTVTDANQHWTRSVSDILGRTKSVTPQIGPNVVFDYDALGNLTSANRGGAEVTMTYDKAGRKTSMDDPDMGDWVYTYDALGNLKTQTDARQCVTTLNYDALNRLTSKSYSSCSGVAATPSVSYGYDSGTYGIGQRTSMSMGDGSSSASWEYDFRGRLRMETKTIDAYSNVTRWTYNSADLPASMTYYGGEMVTYEYNDRMLLETVTSDNATPTNYSDDIDYVASSTYDSAGRINLRTFGNGLSQKYIFNAWNDEGGRLEKIVAGSGTWNEATQLFTSTIQKLSYGYDMVGNVTQIAQVDFNNNNQIETQSYQYDALNRLTNWDLTVNGATIQSELYQYDSAGNLSNKAGVALSYPTNGIRPHAATSASVNTFVYDNNGNQTSRTVAGNTYQLGYDAESRLVSVTGPSLNSQFVYNGDGQRVKSIVNGETVYFVNGYYEKKGNEITKYYLAGASRVAMRKTVSAQTNVLTYTLGDHIGSTSLAVDASTGDVVETRYKPWGEVRYTTANKTLPTRYTFTGQYSYMNDDATDLGAAGFGLMFYNARWYDPMAGRFAQADSIVTGGVQGLDRYSYANNSPMMYIDPSGHTYMCGETCEEEYENKPETDLIKIAKKNYGVVFSSGWSAANMAAVFLGVYSAAVALQNAINSSMDATYQSCLDNMAGPGSTCSRPTHVSTSQAFSMTFNTSANNPLKFQWSNSTCGCYADAYGFPNTITVYASTYVTIDGVVGTGPTPVTPELIVHELGHFLNSYADWGPATFMNRFNGGSLLARQAGFAIHFSNAPTDSEIFADMFVGWVFGRWANDTLGPIRNEVMTTNIVTWATQARMY